jgi:hypothetical protein
MERFPTHNPEKNKPEIENDKLLKHETDIPEELLKHQEEMARFDRRSDDKTKNPLDRIKNYLRILLAGAMLTFGSKVLYEKYEEHVEKQATKEYILKSSLQEKAEKAGFDFKVDVPNGNGLYIVHIGYTHSYNKGKIPKGELIDILFHDFIVKGNKSAEQFLLSLKDKDTIPLVVFTEGYDEQSFGFLEFISSERDKIMSVEADERAVEKIINIINDLPTQGELPRDARISFEYLVSKKLSELSRNNISISNEQLSVLRNVCEQKLGLFDMSSIDERMLKVGAAMKMFIDNECIIAPVESSIIREEIIKLEATLSSLANKLGQLKELAHKGSKEASAEYNKIALQYDTLRATLFREYVLDARENFAVRLIKDIAAQAKIKHGVIPMLYGAGHDFSDNVKNLNESDRKEKIGLITLVPKSYKGVRK